MARGKSTGLSPFDVVATVIIAMAIMYWLIEVRLATP